ncbi:MAG: dipeptide/oligopeptide/nickel ABC transporter ATP-binding protein [Myxococcota bacterium]|nr:dipeptide/oligopeptide/nickel ABC transporter ATP-binding protein [Myxococcota bacterium]
MPDKRILMSGRGLRRTFRSRGFGRPEADVVALDGVDIDIYRGEILALIGESGSGKTTLGKALLRLMELDSGTVNFDGQDLLALTAKELLVARRHFQMVFQNQSANLHPSMTVMQMMLESIKLHRPDLAPAKVEPLAIQLLERVSLVGKANQNTLSLSGGEKRRVGLARILATQPKLIVADEPTSGLDAAIKLGTIELLKKLKSEEMAYLVISHDLGLVQRIADRVLVMLNGQIIEELSTAVLSAGGATHPYTQQLLAASNLDRMAPRRSRVSSETGASEVHQ